MFSNQGHGGSYRNVSTIQFSYVLGRPSRLKGKVNQKPLYISQFQGDVLVGYGDNLTENMAGHCACAPKNVTVTAFKALIANQKTKLFLDPCWSYRIGT